MKNLKIVGIILVITTILLTFCMPIVTYSATIDPEDYNPSKNPIQVGDYDEVAKVAKTVINVIQSAGVVIAIVGLMAIGIKYITGSVEQRANYKKTMIPYAVGCVMIFTITQLVSIIYKITMQVTE